MLKPMTNTKYNHDSFLEECLICIESKSGNKAIKVKRDKC